MRFIIFVALAAILWAVCSKPDTPVYLGQVTDFSIHMGSFNSANVSVVTTQDGNKYTVYRTNVRTGLHLYHSDYYGYELKCCPPTSVKGN